MAYLGNQPTDKLLDSNDIVDGAITTSKIAAEAVTSPKVDYDSVSTFSFRNKIINGKMEISQRGTSLSIGPNAMTMIVDRFATAVSGGAVVTASQATDAPASAPEFLYSHRIVVTTADAAIAAGDYGFLEQIIEGYNIRDLIGKTFTLSFWVRSAKTGIHCVAFRNNGTDRSYVVEYTINAANTWEYKTITVTGGLPTAGTWDYTNGVGLRVLFSLACGTTFQTTAGAWNPGNFLATANQVNCLDTVGNIFAVTGVQLEVGTVATPFEHRPIAAELALCQRYYQAMRVGGYSTTTYIGTAGPLYVPMRANPTTTMTDIAGTAGRVTTATGNGIVISAGGLGALAAYGYRMDAVLASSAANWWTVFAAFNAEL